MTSPSNFSELSEYLHQRTQTPIWPMEVNELLRVSSQVIDNYRKKIGCDEYIALYDSVEHAYCALRVSNTLGSKRHLSPALSRLVHSVQQASQDEKNWESLIKTASPVRVKRALLEMIVQGASPDSVLNGLQRSIDPDRARGQGDTREYVAYRDRIIREQLICDDDKVSMEITSLSYFLREELSLSD